MENRASSLEGSRFFPVSAAVCFFATTSALVSILCGKAPLPPEAQRCLEGIVGSFFIIALATSSLAMFSMAVAGSDDLGRVTIRGRRLPMGWLIVGYWAAFVLPWITAVLAIVLVVAP